MMPTPSEQKQPTFDVLGWRPRDLAPARSSIDYAQTATWTVARLWSTAGTLETSGGDRGSSRVILSVDGSASILYAGAKITLEPRQMIILDDALPVVTENDALWARCEWLLRSPTLQHQRLSPYFHRPIDIPQEYRHLFTGVTNSISTSPDIASGLGSSALLETLASTVTAAIMDAVGAPVALTPAASSLFHDAMRRIDAQFHDVSFSVSHLAEQMSISTTHLHRVFAAAGTTPRQELEIWRVVAARTILGAAPTRGKVALDDLARRAGFSSSKHMQVALRRQRTRSESE